MSQKHYYPAKVLYSKKNKTETLLQDFSLFWTLLIAKKR